MAVETLQFCITEDEYRARCDALLAHIQEEGLSGVVLFDRDYILYYAGFAFIPTERPIVFAMNSAGERALYVPRLEVEHAQANALIERVAHYIEYPGDPHPMYGFVEMLHDMGIQGAVGADNDGYPWILGYRGEALSVVGDFDVQHIAGFVEDQMAIKSPAEVNLLIESCRWANLAHMLLQRYTVVGATETEVSLRASMDATLAMMDAIGPLYRAQSEFAMGASAGYRGQIGRNAAIPHALANNMTFQDGDLLVTGATAPVWGYVSELERTMVLGQPTDEQMRYFDHMINVQDIAFENIKPGRPCSDVDVAVRAYFTEHDLMPYWKHHSGHTIGMRYHEGPYLDTGDHTIIKPGMVFTVEPGLYVPGLGGFRHSDTVLVTESGVKMLTYYPRDLESLTLPV